MTGGKELRGGPGFAERFSGKGLADVVKAEKAKDRAGRKKVRQSPEGTRSAPAAGPDRERPGGQANAAADEDAHGALVRRLYRAFTGQMDQIEARLGTLDADGADLGEIDKTVKTLASLARTLTMLMDLDREAGGKEAAGEDGDNDDQLRRELAQRLDRLRASRAAGGAA
ncbi:hypothetical protein [Roseibium sp. RKSG952]|uniref:hypothetical protein n=1 Tax=Roseibium sp. RKSG952 TaxID=2529384 RepID=UPI0012BB5C76|nr:hypothetical protein [Roseibium sp. RKSG952]MTH95863.1 hypothetical protein [Roseibium sp. RKSG952]